MILLISNVFYSNTVFYNNYESLNIFWFSYYPLVGEIYQISHITLLHGKILHNFFTFFICSFMQMYMCCCTGWQKTTRIKFKFKLNRFCKAYTNVHSLECCSHNKYWKGTTMTFRLVTESSMTFGKRISWNGFNRLFIIRRNQLPTNNKQSTFTENAKSTQRGLDTFQTIWRTIRKNKY